MSTPKRYYWIKLKESFMSSDTVDFLMSQKDGANYVVLYQLLCLKTINTGGRLSRTIGEVVIPYDVEKIQRDCKWFSSDTVRIALTLYKRFGLIYEAQDGTLVLAEHENLVGSETNWAVQKRNQQLKQTQSIEQKHNHSAAEGGNGVETGVEIFHPDIRDKDIKSLDIRVQSSDTREREQDTGGGGWNHYGDGKPAKPDPLAIYATNNLRHMSPVNLEELVSFRDALSDELIQYAIDEACGNGVPTYNYVRAILNRFVDSGFKNVSDAKAADEKRQEGGAADGKYRGYSAEGPQRVGKGETIL